MSHIVTREPWATVDINVTEHRIFVREDWQYTWTTEAGQPEWTPEEQHHFHHLVDRSIWAQWSWRPLIRVQRRHPDRRSPGWQLREELARSPLPVTFDVRRVSMLPHWTVTVVKRDPTKERKRAEVVFGKRTILLFSTDLIVKRARRFQGDQPYEGFKVHPHEFGHTLGYLEEEYDRESDYFEDRDSIMNVGRDLRARHVTKLCQTLQTMVPGCEFVPFISSGMPASHL